MTDLRFEMYVDDAAEWISQLRADPRFSRVIVAGHSEGSLIGMLSANKAHANAFVSIAGVAHRASDVLRDQLAPPDQLDAIAMGSLRYDRKGARVVIEGMNHVMKRAPVDRAQNVATYGNPDLPIVPEVPKAIVELAKRTSRP